MRINRSTSLMLSAAVALAVAAPAAANRPQDAKSQQTDSLYFNCEDGTYSDTEPATNHIEYNGDDVMWPPNHKTQDHAVIARDDDGSGATTIFTMSTHDEFFTNDSGEEEELNGAGNTTNDAEDAHGSADAAAEGDGEAETTVTLRSERSGRGDGRTYTITANATFDDEPTDCTAEFTVEVPHDMRSDNAPEPKSPSLNEDGSPKGGNGGGNS